jgi:peptide/nickel transport system substrate-binding protein
MLDSWILPGHWAAAPADSLARYPYDPERARTLLDEAGVIDIDEDGMREQGIDHDSDGTLESGTNITLTLLTTAGTPLRTQIAERIQSDLAEIGLATTIATTDTRQLFSPDGPLFRRSFELSQFAWIANPDPRGFELWGCGAIPSQSNNWSGSNLAGWCDREANQAIISATTSLDLQTRRAAYLQQQQRFSQELPILPLFQRLTLVLHYPGLRGVRPDPIAPITWNIAEWNRE